MYTYCFLPLRDTLRICAQASSPTIMDSTHACTHLIAKAQKQAHTLIHLLKHIRETEDIPQKDHTEISRSIASLQQYAQQYTHTGLKPLLRINMIYARQAREVLTDKTIRTHSGCST